MSFPVANDIDVLFVIDNSGSMAEEQIALTSAFGSFVEVLEQPGVASSYRIGITTTDNGNPWCGGTSPEAGTLRLSSCRSRPEEFTLPEADLPVPNACTATCPEELTDIEIRPTPISGSREVRPRDWIESNEGLTNLPEGLSAAEAFQCFGPQGIDGCGFESPLESMWKAVRRSLTADDPASGFIREGSILSVVHVTDEEDCSYDTDWETIFLPEGNKVFWSDPEATSPTSAVCWNAGVVCDGAGPTYDDCYAVDLDVEGSEVPEDDADDLAVLRPMSRYVDLLGDIERDKQQLAPEQQVLVSVIGGVGADGSVTYRNDPAFEHDFGIGPGCEGPSGRATPLVRLRELAEAFGVDGERNMFSSCEGDYSAALTAIAESIIGQIPPTCMPVCVADTDPSTPSVDPSCTFEQQSPAPNGSIESITVPPCESDAALPDGYDVCFATRVGDERSETCADRGFNLELRFVRRPGIPAPEGAAVVGSCEKSESRELDCPELP